MLDRTGWVRSDGGLAPQNLWDTATLVITVGENRFAMSAVCRQPADNPYRSRGQFTLQTDDFGRHNGANFH